MAPSDRRPIDEAARRTNADRNREECERGAVVLESKPTLAWLSVTGNCNLLCSHCPRSLVDEQFLSHDEMTPTVFARLQDELFPTLVQLRIGGNNLGEQLFARSWSRYAEAMSGEPFTPWLITNGQALNQTRIEQLVSTGYIVDVSIDAASDAGYRRIRGARLATLVHHVRAIAAARDRFEPERPPGRPRTRIIFSFTAFAENIAELPGLVRLAAELGVDEVVATHYMPSFEVQRHQSLFYHQSEANRIFEEARRLGRETGVEVRVPPPYGAASLGQVRELRPRVQARYEGEPPAPEPSSSTPPCRHPWTSVSVNERGEVYPCCQSNLLMGDLRKSSLTEIWNNARYRRLRRTVNSDRPLPDCRRCVLRGEEFTSVNCREGSYFLRNLDLPAHRTDPRWARAREAFARTRLGRWMWKTGRSAYKNFFEWRFASR